MQHTTIYEKSCYHKCRKLVTNTTINYVNLTLCVVGVDVGNAVTPSTGPPTSDGVLYILHMGDGTIPTVRKNKFTENRQSVNESLIFDNWRCVYKNWGHTGPLNCTL